jgi:F-type H+-transporting ATPase subunit a
VNLWKLPEIVIAPEEIFRIGGFPVTNTLLSTWITIVALVVLFYFGTRRRDMIPSGLQNFLEWAIELLIGMVEGVAGKVKGKKFFPIVATFFVFIVVCNLQDVIPGVDTIGAIKTNVLTEHPGVQPVAGFLLFGDISNAIIPWLRPATTDLNLTLAMAAVSVVVTQVFGFIMLGAKAHLLKYFNFRALLRNGPLGIVEFFVGLLEIVSELSRIISFSFRLFGNIFAGSVVLAIFAFLLPVVASIVFLPFELFVAFMQALVFSMLTLVFLQMGTTSHGSHGDDVHDKEGHLVHTHEPIEEVAA